MRDDLSACRHCEREGLIPKARPIFQLPGTATIGLFSQAPGNLAHQGGRPFMDPSGVRLRAWMGIDEATFYGSGRLAIVPMAFCFPGYDGKSSTGKGGDLPPPRVCADMWRARVLSHLPRLRLVLLVGGYSQAWHLGAAKGRTLSETVGRWRDRVAEAETTGQLVLPLPHPSWRNNAWLAKNPWFEAEILPLLKAHVADALS